MHRLALVIALLANVGCKTTTREIHPDDYVPDDMPGYRISIPLDLPATYQTQGKKSGAVRDHNDVLAEYVRGHGAGWRECLFGYFRGEVDLSQNCPDRSGSPKTLRTRAYRDGYEECRRMLLSNGNK